MKIENIYPSHTTEEEWNELAFIASKMLSAMSQTMQKCDAPIAE